MFMRTRKRISRAAGAFFLRPNDSAVRLRAPLPPDSNTTCGGLVAH